MQSRPRQFIVHTLDFPYTKYSINLYNLYFTHANIPKMCLTRHVQHDVSFKVEFMEKHDVQGETG